MELYQKTLVLLKPDAVQRKLVGKIISRFDDASLKIHALKFMNVPKELAIKHYEEHKGKVFFDILLDFITSGPIVAIVIGGQLAVQKVRKITGATEPANAEVGSIRGSLAHQAYDPSGKSVIKNLIHASESIEAANKEIKIWFSEDEIVEYSAIGDEYLGLK